MEPKFATLVPPWPWVESHDKTTLTYSRYAAALRKFQHAERQQFRVYQFWEFESGYWWELHWFDGFECLAFTEEKPTLALFAEAVGRMRKVA